jgi:serine/threonine-protein kinase
MATLEGKLPALLKGEFKPRDTAERLGLAGVCAAKKLHHASTRLYADAFAADPLLATNLEARHRYDAACYAALAGTGQGKDIASLDDTERAELRYCALSWLHDDLSAHASRLQPGTAAQVRQSLLHWQKDPDLAAVRDPGALDKLPEAEQVAWLNLWAQVDALLARSAGRGQ